MTIYKWGETRPQDLASKKMDSKWRTRYVDYKFPAIPEYLTRVKIMSFNGNCEVRSVKNFKNPNL